MKLNKRTGAVLGFLLAAGSATAATGWLTNYTWTYDTLKKEPVPAVIVTDDDDGTWTTVKTGSGLPAAVAGTQADGVAQTANPVVIGAKSVVDGQVETLFSQGGFLAQVPIGAVTEGSAIVNPVTAGGKDSAGASRAIRVSTAGRIIPEGTNAPCTSLKLVKASVPDGTASTTVDAGATGTALWFAFKNDSRTYSVDFTLNSTTGHLDHGESFGYSLANAATPDSVAIVTNCTGCGGAAVPITATVCDDD